jgi:hypothetical protein
VGKAICLEELPLSLPGRADNGARLSPLLVARRWRGRLAPSFAQHAPGQERQQQPDDQGRDGEPMHLGKVVRRRAAVNVPARSSAPTFWCLRQSPSAGRPQEWSYRSAADYAAA